MRAGDSLGDSAQGSIGFTVIVKAVAGYGNDIGLALPLAHQPCAEANLVP